MSKLSKRAISTLVITILLISTLAIANAGVIADLSLTLESDVAGATGWLNVEFTSVAGGTGDLVLDFSAFGPTATDMDLSATTLIGVTFTGFSTNPDALVVDNGAAKTLTFTGGVVSAITACDITGLTITNDQDAETQAVTIDIASGADTGSDVVTIVAPTTGTLSISTIPFDGNAVVQGVAGYEPTPRDEILTPDTYMVEFQNYGGWFTPDPQYPVVTAGETTIVIGEYVLMPTTEFSISFVTPGDADYGKVLTVCGTGVTSGSSVNIYWDFVTAADLLNATTGLSSGNFECTVKVPSAYHGDHYLWAKDLSTGLSTRSEAIFVVPKIKMSPSSGLKYDDITIKGYGFSEDSDIDITFAPIGLSDDGGVDVDETDDLGYFEYIFEVDTIDDGDYLVTAEDAATHSTSATFTVGAAISIDKEVGPAGTIVKVEGRGFGETLVALVITMDGVPVSTKDGGEVTVPASGLFTAYIVIPSVSEGEHEITILDGTDTVTATFEVDGETSITVTPGYGTPGTVLTVKGYNFTRISGTEVVLAIEDQTAETTTDASGSFTATIIVPPLDFGVRYPVIANDTRLCNAEDEVLVALIVLQLSKYSAPVGAEVMLMGSGFTKGAEGGEWNATIGDIDLIETTPIGSAVTYFSYYWYVPSLPTGTYTINVLDLKEEIEVGIDFTITDPAALSVSRASIPNGYNLTFEGTNFVELADQETEWWIYNSTDAWNIDDNVTQGESLPISPVPVTDEDGEIISWYMIPEFLELGSYCINCTTVSNDQVDPFIIQTAEVCIELVPEEIVINVGGPSYARGQTITFVIKATLKKAPFYLGIKDPEGSEFFNSTWIGEDWKTLGSWFYIPSNLQVDDNTEWLYTLPTDALPGTWTYSFWDEDKEYANGTFQVTQLTEIQQLQQDIGELSSGIDDIMTSNEDLGNLVADLSVDSAAALDAAAAAAAAAADAKTAADASTAAISDVEDMSSDALDAANDAKSAADAAKAAADSGLAAANDAKATSQAAADAADKAADSAEANQKATSGLTGLVYGAIGASLIAALAAIVSLMQISRRIAG